MSTIYMMRGQGLGVMHSDAYSDFPTPEHVRAALGQELALHGFKDGKPRKRWVKIQPVQLHDGRDTTSEPPKNAAWHYEGELTQAEVDEMMKTAPPGTMLAGVGEVAPSGTGTAMNPDDPGFAAAKATLEAEKAVDEMIARGNVLEKKA